MARGGAPVTINRGGCGLVGSTRPGINRSRSLNRGNTLDLSYATNDNFSIARGLAPVDSAPNVTHSSKLPRRQDSLTVPNAAARVDEGAMHLFENPGAYSPGAMRKTSSFCSHADFYQHALMVRFYSNQFNGFCLNFFYNLLQFTEFIKFLLFI